MKTRFAAYFLACCAFIYGCNDCLEGSGPRSSRFIPLDSVSELYLDVVADFTVKVDSIKSNRLEIIAQEGLQQAISAQNINGMLTISIDGCTEKNEEILFESVLNEVNKFTINSAGLIQSESILVQKDLWLKNKGLGELNFAIKSDHITSEIRSSGDITLAGETSKMDFLTTSSGDLRAYNLICDTLVLNIYGSSVCDVYVNKHLVVNFFSNGRVNYRGNPPSIEVNGEGQILESSI